MLGDRFGSHQRDSQQTGNSRRDDAPGAAPETGTGHHAVSGGADQPSADDAGDHTGWTHRTTPPPGDRPASELIDALFARDTPGDAAYGARASDAEPSATRSLTFTREPRTGVFGPATASSSGLTDLGGAGHDSGHNSGHNGGPDAGPDAGPATTDLGPATMDPGPMTTDLGIVRSGGTGRADEPSGADADDLPRVVLTPPEGAPVGAGPDGRRRPRGRAVKVGAVAATLAVLAAGTAVTVSLTGEDEPAETQVLAARQAADPAQAAERQRVATEQRRRAVKDAAARAGRDAFRDRPGLGVKSKPKPQAADPAAPGPVGPVLAGSPRAIARKMLPKFGWSASSQFGCLDQLWQKESGWNPRAANPSGAYGIPQALPGSKMASAGADWETNPATQIEWGLGYIKGRYASPCGAWSHSQSAGWY